MTIVTEVKLDVPLDEATITRARTLRVQWLQTYNQLKNTPGGGAHHAELLTVAETALDTLDMILAAQPTIN